ncbi:hypothetical protein GCM10007147_13820 [Nocardiopsis kunsanensis]|uniref:Uncharacterized protein n=1 Tax=Nocardiopsis kunsanensis TaxID=141693 RepID=A0A918XB29_9ACTN|nr:hypothetical protein GCM10007147_13820 [Nocardiopsis kunsanensis]
MSCGLRAAECVSAKHAPQVGRGAGNAAAPPPGPVGVAIAVRFPGRGGDRSQDHLSLTGPVLLVDPFLTRRGAGAGAGRAVALFRRRAAAGPNTSASHWE